MIEFFEVLFLCISLRIWSLNNNLFWLFQIYSLLSLATSHLQGRYPETIKQEAINKFLTAASDHGVG